MAKRSLKKCTQDALSLGYSFQVEGLDWKLLASILGYECKDPGLCRNFARKFLFEKRNEAVTQPAVVDQKNAITVPTVIVKKKRRVVLTETQ